MRVYFDNAATTPMTETVIAEMTRFMRQNYGNPSSIHAEGRVVRHAIEQARKVVANYLHASLGEVFFTSCGTESNNMAIKCAVRDLGVRHVITSNIEHHCVMHTVQTVQRHRQAQVTILPVNEIGRIDYAALENALAQSQTDRQPTLVSLMHANNEVGTMIDLERVAALCVTYGAYFHSDTVQTIGHHVFDLSKIKIDFLSGSAHKFHGPKGAGFIYINQNTRIQPFIDGGSQERNMRAGTENVAGIVGLAKALEEAAQSFESQRRHIAALRARLMEQLLAHFGAGIRFNGDLEGESLYTVLSVSFPPSPQSGLLVMALDIAGIAASGGSACSSGAEQGSHVIAALHPNSNWNTIRFSFSHQNTLAEVDYVVEKIKQILPL